MPGQIVILNGAPRSGKSSIATAIQATCEGIWVNIGVDRSMASIPKDQQPGIGLRPGGERPDLEPIVVQLYSRLWEEIAAQSQAGLCVVSDLGLHDAYSRPLKIINEGARALSGLPVLFVGVRCPTEAILQRRRESGMSDKREFAERWDQAVHAHEQYDVEVDTSMLSPEACAEIIRDRILLGPAGTAFHRFAKESTL